MTESLSRNERSARSQELIDPSSPGADGATAADNRLNVLYIEHGEALTKYLRKAFGDGPPDPEDVTQDAFEKLAQEDLTEIRNPRAFIWRMARNLMLSGLRKVDVRTKYDFEIEHLFFAAKGSELSPERVIEVRDQLKIISRVIAEMPETRRVAFLMNRIEGKNYSAIGRHLGMSPNGVIKHVSRAVFDLKAALEDQSEPE